MNKKIQVGDIIKFIKEDGIWDGPAYTYTILDIDTSRVIQDANGVPFYSHIYIQWETTDKVHQTWTGNLERINEKLNKGQIIIINPRMEPIKDIKKFTL